MGVSHLLLDARHRPGPEAWAVTTLTFDVPEPAATLRVDVDLEAPHRRTRVDATLHDPIGFRGFAMTERGHTTFVVGDTHATPGSLRGPVRTGRWTFALRWVNVEGDVVARVRVRLEASDREGAAATARIDAAEREGGGESPTVRPDPPAGQRRWVKGELHAHSRHSTGRHTVPDLVAAAREADLGFLSITDHNTIAAWGELADAQGRHPDVVLLRGQELTVPWGHANVHGARERIDPELAPGGIAELIERVHAAGGLFGVNHPFANDAAWQRPDTPWAHVDLLEVEHALEGDHNPLQRALWDRLWGAGASPVGVAAADVKDVRDPRYAFGRLVTWVEVDALSERGVLAGLRRGRTVVSRGPFATLDVPRADAAPADAPVPDGGVEVELRATIRGLERATTAYLLRDGFFLAAPVAHADGLVRWTDRADAGTCYRLELHALRDAPGAYDRRVRSAATFLASTQPVRIGPVVRRASFEERP